MATFETILVAVGSNLPGPGGRSPLAICAWAVARLAAIEGLRLVAVSRWYRTPAWPPSDQPDYVNGVVRLAGGLAPRAVLAALQAIEAEGGRVRGAPNAARTLDLDVVGIDGLVLDTPDLVVPHPRMAARAFVLAPLCDVAPGWVHPVLGQTAAALLAALAVA